MSGPGIIPGLQWRRQYLLAPTKLEGLKDWGSTPLGSCFHLHAHPDLPVCHAEAGPGRAVLAGFIVDPAQPEQSSQEVLQNLLVAAPTATRMAEALYSMGGRWVLFLQ